MQDYFARLGALVERAWTKADRDEAIFPKIAEDALLALHPRDHFDRERFLDGELDPTLPARRERAPLGAFGQPGVTVHFGRDFVIEVYFWVDSLSGVHDHPFHGLFTILEGESVHARYSFHERDRPSARLRIGEVRPEGIELLEKGDHRLFGDSSHPLIHALLHVHVPSISMVIRTIRTRDYYRYLPPSLALLVEEPDQVIAKQIAFLESLRQIGDPRYEERLARYLAEADLETAIVLLFSGWSMADEPTRARRLESLRERHGQRVDAILPAFARATRMQQANELRQRLVDRDDRLVATALLCAENRAQVLELIGARHADPRARLSRFLDELGLHAVGDESSVAAARILLEGKGREGVEAHIAATFGAETVARQRGQIARFCAESAVGVLTE